MANKAKELRQQIQLSGSPMRLHSMNQECLKFSQEGSLRLFGSQKGKAAKAEERQRREQYFLELFPRNQFNRVLRQVINGDGTPESIDYLLKNMGHFEEVVFANDKVEITIVDFSSG